MTSIALNPEIPSFGCVAVGFVYSLKVVLTNVGPVMERFKVALEDRPEDEEENKIKCIYTPHPSAPGMQSVIKLVFYAKCTNHHNFSIRITRGIDKFSETFAITALVVSSDSFKKISHGLKMKKKEVYAPGVSCLGTVSATQSSIIGEGYPSIYTESLISDEELEDLKLIPFVGNVYYNPYSKRLIRDEVLSKVCTGNRWSVEESQQRTTEEWEKRLLELEMKGMVTERLIGQMIKDGSLLPTNSTIDSV